MAVCSPTWRMPRAARMRDSGRRRDRSMAATRFSALFCAKRSRPTRSSTVSRKKSAGPVTRPRASSCSSTAKPAPSMSMPPRPTKCERPWMTCAGQKGLLQRWRTSPSSRTTGALQTGQRAGISNSRSVPSRASGEDAHDLRDDVAGLVEQDAVADAHVLAAHLVEVVERGPGHGRAGHEHRPQVRDRCQRPRPADVGHDVLDHGLDLLGRELVGDGPAGRPADHAQPCLEVGAVHLDHDAVGLVGQVVAGLAPALGEGDDALHVQAARRGWARPGSPVPRGAPGRPPGWHWPGPPSSSRM